jgi:hypothetical protein
MAELERDATALGLKLPAAFIKLFTNDQLMQRVQGNDYNVLRISGGLRKVPALVDGGAGGYSISFMCEGDNDVGGTHRSLYLKPDGTHCILETWFDTGIGWDEVDQTSDAVVTEEERQEARSQGREMAYFEEHDTSLAGVEFEEWLVILCHEHEISQVDCDCFQEDEDEHETFSEGEVVREELKEYVKVVYVRPQDGL